MVTRRLQFALLVFALDALGHVFSMLTTLLWIIAVILVIWGIITAIRGQLLMGILLIVVGLLVGPGGVSFFT
jgi:hypothetical protein